MKPSLGLSHHQAFEPVLAAHPDAVDFLSVTTEALLAPEPRHDATLALTDRYRVALHGSALALTASAPFDTLRARRLASFADQCVFEWVAERLEAPTDPVPDVLDHVVERVERLQDFLGGAVLVSNGLGFHGAATSTTATLAFLSTLAERTGCGLLLDLDTLCHEAPLAAASDPEGCPGDATGNAASDLDPLIAALGALNLDAVRGIAIRGLLVDSAAQASGDTLGTRPAVLLKRLVAECRHLRGITIALAPPDAGAIGIDDFVASLDQMRSALPRPAGIVAFPGLAADRQDTAAPRPRGYLPGHGRGAPMRLVHCAPEADTPPATGAGDTPPTSGA